MSITGEATWIPSGGRSLSGWVHRPEGATSNGVVVLAPSIGREHVISYRSMRALAIVLARAGLVAVRFAWTGTGESAPLPGDADPVATWQDDLRAVARFARAVSGHDAVDAIGLRVGAALLGSVDGARWGRRILWEPVSGRAFVRHHRALRMLAVPEVPASTSATIDLGGVAFDFGQVDSLARLAVRSDPAERASASQLLTIIEADRNVAARLYAVPSAYATVPFAALDRLAADLPRRPERPLPGWVPTTVATHRTGGPAGAGDDVLEEIVEIGPDRLPAVLTRPVDGRPRRSLSALFVAASAEPKDGATGLWVAAARALALDGVTSLRVDRRGVGDLADESADRDPNPYTVTAIDDLRTAARWLAGERRDPIVGVGLCSGAWLLGMASATSPIDHVVMLNNAAWRDQPAFYDRVDRRERPEGRGGGATEPTRIRRLRLWAKRMLLTRAPYRLWLALAGLALVDAPEIVMEPSSRTSTLSLHFGAADYERFRIHRGHDGLRRLTPSRSILLHRHEFLDHALLADTSRAAALAIIAEEFRRIGAVTEPAGSA